MTRDEAVKFAVRSAMAAFDQAGAYGGLENSIAAHRENIRDTLNDEQISKCEAEAWQAFDAKVSQLRNL